MKKFILFCIAAVFCGNAMAQDQKAKLVGADITLEAANQSTELVLSIEAVNEEAVGAIAQVIITCPEGIEIQKNDRGRYTCTKGELWSPDHAATIQAKEDGSVVVIIKNEYGDPFEAASGTLITLPVKVGDVEDGIYNIELSSIVIGTNDNPSVKLNPEATEGVVKVTIGDVTGINSLKADNSNEPAFNLAGQQVGKNYKGIVVKNGKKTLVK